MRKNFSLQGKLGLVSLSNLELNLECRDGIIPVLAGLQYVFSQPDLCNSVIELVMADISKDSSSELGREGFDYWQIVVLAAVRLGCNLDYDKLQDLCENHRSLRCALQVSDWDDTSFNWRRIRNNLCLLSPQTIQKMNQLIVAHGQDLHGDARSIVRADSFVVETNIHYPTESSLIWDGVRKVMKLCVDLAWQLDEPGWRQAAHHLKAIKKRTRVISQISSSKSPKAKGALPGAYRKLLEQTETVLERAKSLQKLGAKRRDGSRLLAERLGTWIELTERVCDTARRRVLLGESVPNDEKLFSLFETHTQLYQRGKAGKRHQFGRLVFVVEDNAGFISHYSLMDRKAQDTDIIVDEMKQVQTIHNGEVKRVSLDRGFYTKENVTALSTMVDIPCVLPRNPKQYAEALSKISNEFRETLQRHPGIESAIGALQRGNGLARCRDRTELGIERYLGTAILGRNIHVLGKLLIARASQKSEAATSKRKAC